MHKGITHNKLASGIEHQLQKSEAVISCQDQEKKREHEIQDKTSNRKDNLLKYSLMS